MSLILDVDQKGISQRFPLLYGIHNDDFLQVEIYSPLSASGGQATNYYSPHVYVSQNK